MSELQLSHVALVGARIDDFRGMGVTGRRDLTARRAIPPSEQPLYGLPQHRWISCIKAQLPLWVHNVIVDRGFPQREKLVMALRRFEGELRDHRDNPVVSAVLTAGFRDRHLDPLDLPGSMPMRQRCSMLMQAAIWKEAYLELEADFIRILGDRAADVDQWLQVGTEAPLAAGA